jgi:hypothetical protein
LFTSDAKPGTKDAGILGWLMEKKKYDAQADNAAASTVESPKVCDCLLYFKILIENDHP